MGLMTALLILFHVQASYPLRLLNTLINDNGNIGVDGFVFLSGFGLAYALGKSDGFGSYYGRRLARILPSYYAYLIILLATYFVEGYRGLPTFFIPRLIPIGLWVNEDFHRWYVSAALGFYVIATFIYPLLKRSRFMYLTTALLLAFVTLILPGMSKMENASLAITRLPALVTGLAVGTAAQRQESRYQQGWPGLVALALTFFAGAVMFAFDRRLAGVGPFRDVTPETLRFLGKALMTPLLCVCAAWGFELCPRVRLGFVNRAFEVYGRYSLEIYLMELGIIKLLRLAHLPTAALLPAALLLSLPAGMAIHWIGAQLLDLWRKLLPRLTA